MAEITYLHDVTDQDIPPERVLEAAKGHCTEAAIVIGWGDDEALYFAMSTGGAGAILLALERAKALLMEQVL